MQNVPAAPARPAAPPQIHASPAASPHSTAAISPPASAEKTALKFPGTNCLRVCESIMWMFLILRLGVGWWMSSLPKGYDMGKEYQEYFLSFFSTIALVAFFLWLALLLPSFLYTNFRWLLNKTK